MHFLLGNLASPGIQGSLIYSTNLIKVSITQATSLYNLEVFYDTYVHYTQTTGSPTTASSLNSFIKPQTFILRKKV